MSIIINESLAKKVKEVVECGLSNGIGVAEPGKMCVEAAVNYACGLPHGDNPSCVGYAVRAFKIALNDKQWSSNEARAKGMLRIAIAQLGSNTIDQQKFVELLSIKTVSIHLSRFLKKYGFEAESKKCEQANDLKSAAESAKSAAEYAAKYAAESAEYAAKSAEYAEYAEYAAKSNPDEYYIQLSDICLECLIELKSPGCEFLYLVD